MAAKKKQSKIRRSLGEGGTTKRTTGKAKAKKGSNPLVKANAAQFGNALNKATVAQMKDALKDKGLTARKRSRIEAALACREQGRAANKSKSAKATAAADQENARLRDERAASKDGMTASERAMAESKPKSKKRKSAKAKGKMSGLDAAAKVLGETGKAMTAEAIVEAILARKLWATSGQTPDQTLYAAMLRESKAKGDRSRFAKVDRGLWALTEAGKQAT